MPVLKEMHNMFWALVLEDGRRYSQKVEQSFHISMAAVEIPSDTEVLKGKHNQTVSVMVASQKSDFLICSLNFKNITQQPLDLNFNEGEEVTFFINGPGTVHLTGYQLEDDEDFDDGLLDEMEEGDSDNEVPTLVKTSKRKMASEPNVVKKKMKWLTPGGTEFSDDSEDDSDDDDSDDDDEIGMSTLDMLEIEAEEDDEDDDDFDIDDDEDDDDDDDESEEENVPVEKTPKPANQGKKEKQTPKQDIKMVKQTPKHEQSKNPNQDKNKTPKQEQNKTLNQGKNKTPKQDQNKTPKQDQNKTPNQDKNKTPKQDQNKTPKQDKSTTPKQDQIKSPKQDQNKTPKQDKKEQGKTSETPNTPGAGADATSEQSAKKKRRRKKKKHSENGVESPSPQGAQTPQQGAKTPQQGAKTPQQGAKTPQQGTKSPQQGAKTPQQGTKTQQQGAKTPQQGAKTPQQNTPKNPSKTAQDQQAAGKTPQNKPDKQNKTPKRQVLGGGIISEEIKVGDGAAVKSGKMAHVYYVGKLQKDSKQFDSCTSGKPFKFKLGLGEVIQGWDKGVEGMRVGGKRRLTVPPQQAYGNQRSGPIPPNSTLVFEVELKNVS